MNTEHVAPARTAGGWVKVVALWTVTVLLAAAYCMAGVMKLVSPEAAAAFAAIGFPYWFCILIGLIEAGGAVALLVPRTAFYGAVALGVVMVGAVVTLLATGKGIQAAIPFVFLLVLAAVAYARRPAFGVNRVKA